jgi:peroxiredoxin
MTARDSRRARTAASPSHVLSRRLGPIPVWLILAGVVVGGVVLAIAAINTIAGGTDEPALRYDVGRPGVGEDAPDFALPSTDGGTFRLSDQRGKNVLLYFHEGLTCAPCWRQVDNIQADLASFRQVGVDELAAISIDPLDAQQQRAELRGIGFPVLADTDLTVSQRYDALSYGMMGRTRPGHTFILVGADGRIRWRADYGGAPDFTMYVPDAVLLDELRTALGGAE